ncbi:hypothetical protein V6N11_030376 [Hibiscus sabdariffa]|uniref:Uncharacterized protein n=1 Tax=Hibiscus sabdariffa TaxID=183260 RepID=A0ABR2PKP8_9ROSI
MEPLLASASFLLSFLLFFDLSSSASPPHISLLFESWCHQHGKTYSSEQEKSYRLRVFEDNYAFVTQHNDVPNSSFSLALNAFADLTHHEFKASRLGLSAAAIEFRRPNLGIPTTLFEIFRLHWIGGRKAPSPRSKIKEVVVLVGHLRQPEPWKFVSDNHGIDTEEDYPYQGRQKTCNKDKMKRRVVTIDGFADVPTNNEKQLLQAVATQPVSVGICGSERAFQLYSKGIFTGPCSTSLDHAVLIVGYGSENGLDYWIVKNSWGSSWGMDGYIHMTRNSGNSEGVCGINMLASYPIKTGRNPPPGPGPTKCGFFSYCSAGETCCCTHHLFGICFSWKCCESDSAVCCKDNRHCCPHDYPICDTKSNQCFKRVGNATITEASEKNQSFRKFSSW